MLKFSDECAMHLQSFNQVIKRKIKNIIFHLFCVFWNFYSVLIALKVPDRNGIRFTTKLRTVPLCFLQKSFFLLDRRKSANIFPFSPSH